MGLRINSNFCFLHHLQTRFCNRSGECLPCSTDWLQI